LAGARRAPLPRRWWLAALAGVAVIVAVVLGLNLFGLRDRLFPKPPAELKQRRLTFNSSENGVNQGVISPDGRYLAYSDQMGMHLKLLETGETRDIPQPKGPAPDRANWWPNGWFPDGTRFLTAGQDAAGVSTWVISVVGGPPRKLRDDADGWSVSPDGSLLAFGVGYSNVSVGGLFVAREIWVMTARGEGARRLVPAADNEGFFWAAWSPDGQRIAYKRYRLTSDGMECSIESHSLSGGQPTLLLSEGALCERSHHLWIPDGHLIFTMLEPEPSQNDSNLWEIRLDTRTTKPLAKPRRITNWAGVWLSPLNGTKDGKRLTLWKRTLQADVSVGELEAAGHRVKPPRRLTLDEHNDNPSAWTPDSRAILFVSDRNGSLDIFRQAIDQDAAEPLVTGPDYKWAPVVSPDGTWILYLSRAAGQSGTEPVRPEGGYSGEEGSRFRFTVSTPARVMRVPTSGGPPQLVLEGRGIESLSCARSPATLCVFSEQSPDQKQLVFSAFDPVQGRGRELNRIDIRQPASFWSWDLSADGSRIAFTQFDLREARIQILPLGGGGAREIVVKHWVGLFSVRWAANGQGLVVSPRPAVGAALLRVDLDGATNVLWEQTNVGGPWRSLGVQSPDGRHLAVQSWTREYTLWALENF
jgi:Tol biopolymer transport system component